MEDIKFNMKALAEYMLVHANDKIYVGEVPTTPLNLLSEAMDAGKQIGKTLSETNYYHGKSTMEKVELSDKEKNFLVINERLRKAKNILELAFIAEKTTGKAIIKGDPVAVKSLAALKMNSAPLEVQLKTARKLVKAFDISQKEFIREQERKRTENIR